MPSPEKDFEKAEAEHHRVPADANGHSPDGRHSPSGDSGLSLDDLNAAFAEMLSGGSDPYSAPNAADDDGPPVDEPAMGEVDGSGETDAGCQICPQTILEAMLFVGNAGGEPLNSQSVSRLMRGVRPAEIDDLVRDLNERYDADGRPYRIESQGEGYRLCLRESYLVIADKLFGRNRQVRLSPAAIEVLSLVAYKGPQTSDEIARLRGRPSGALLSQLVRRELLRIERDPQDRRSARYRTTNRFLTLLGIESLDDLPRSPDIERR